MAWDCSVSQHPKRCDVTRDYKKPMRSSKQKKPVPGWVWLTAGLAIGLFVGLLFWLKDRPVQDGQKIVQQAKKEIQARTKEVKAEERVKPRFDFYTLLPEMEVVVPDEEVAPPPAPAVQHPAATGKPVARHEPARPAATPGPAATATPAETYLLQVGSFRNGEQAERFKAELALLGLETSIQKVTIDNKDTYHRVRVGPFRDTGSLNNARSRLAKQGIESRVIKIRK